MRRLVGLVGLLVLGSCQHHPHRKQCPPDETLVVGLCVHPCSSDADCTQPGPDGIGLVCRDDYCQQASITSCSSADDCADGLLCRDGECAFCETDHHCGGAPCDTQTGRCPPPRCETDEECEIDEFCHEASCQLPDPGDRGGPCGLESIYFDHDSDALDEQAMRDLDALASCIIEQNRRVTLEAHADDTGTQEYNILISDRRGRSVGSHLVSRGVPESMLQVVALGDLRAMGLSDAERAKDRRVDIVFH